MDERRYLKFEPITAWADASLWDGLVLPPEEKSEEEYRAKIARGEVSAIYRKIVKAPSQA